MAECSHQHLVLLPGAKDRLQCSHCHLTILRDEIGDGYCPECYEREGVKRSDFVPVEGTEGAKARYRCEECHAIIG